MVIRKELFLARGYPEKMVKEQMKQVAFGKTDKTLEDSTKGALFVFTFHPNLTFLAIINELPKCLHLDLEVKAVLTPTPMVSFRSTRKTKITL